MNRKGRYKYSVEYIALHQRLENKYVKSFTVILRKQIRSFIRQYKLNARKAVADLRTQIYETQITTRLKKMYLEAVPVFGQFQYVNALVAAATPRKKESAAFGFNTDWVAVILDFLSKHLLQRAVQAITETTKKKIMEALDKGQQEGWSVDRIVTELKNVEDLSDVRARRIVRTELSIASNFGAGLAEDELEFETITEWITARDQRVRHSHQVMDGKTVDTGTNFTVPVYKGKTQVGYEQMSGPGDPEASAGNVINCRCTRANTPKRDEDGNLIEKPKKIIPTDNNTKIYV